MELFLKSLHQSLSYLGQVGNSGISESAGQQVKVLQLWTVVSHCLHSAVGQLKTQKTQEQGSHETDLIKKAGMDPHPTPTHTHHTQIHTHHTHTHTHNNIQAFIMIYFQLRLSFSVSKVG